MANRRDIEDFDLPLGEGEDSSNSPDSYSEEAPTKKGRKKREGVFVPLTADGSLDASRIKDSSKLEQARVALGMAPGTMSSEGKPTEEKIDRSLVPLLIQGYTLLLQQSSRLLKFPVEARALIGFDPQQVENMTEPIGRMLDKFAPALLAKNQELAAFVAVMVMESQKSLFRAMVQYSQMQPVVQVPPDAKTNGKATAAPAGAGAPREREFATV